MRIILILLMSVALATSAGCFGKDDDTGTPTPTNPTGTATTPTTGGTTPTGTTPTSPTTGGNNTPAKPAPREVFSGTADFTPAPGTDPNAAQNPTRPQAPFTVAAAYTKLTLNVTWTLSTPAALSGGISVVVMDSAGTAVVTCQGPAAGPVQAAPAPCTMEGTIPATGGDYTASYNGNAGGMGATVSVVAS